MTTVYIFNLVIENKNYKDTYVRFAQSNTIFKNQ